MIIILISILGLGIAIGMYGSSQIENKITQNIKEYDEQNQSNKKKL